MRNLAIIPARSGSKGVPNKNIKKLGGVPLLWWTIEAAIFAGTSEFRFISNPDVPAQLDEKQISFNPIFDAVIVTTNSEEIIESVYKYPLFKQTDILRIHRRNEKLAMDHVQTDEVLLDVLRDLELKGEHYDNVCLLQPTSPFRTYQQITESYEYFRQAKTNPVKRANCLISGTIVLNDIDGYHWFGNNEMATMVEPMGHNPTFRMGRQWESPLPNYLYKENGAIYWFDAEQFSLRRFYRIAPFAIYPMNEESSLDINTMEDWEKAESIVNEWKGVGR